MWRSLHAKAHTNISDSVCKDLYSTQRTYHIINLFNSVKRRARISFWKLFSFTSVYIKKKMTMLTRILASSVRITIDFVEPISFFFYNGGGFCALAIGLQRYIKATKKDTIIYIYIYVGPYEIRLNFSQIPFYFFLNSFFFVSIFLDSVFFRFHFMDSFLMIKLNCIYQKACLIN